MLDAITRQQLPATGVLCARCVAAPQRRCCVLCAQVGDQRLHRLARREHTSIALI